MDRQAHKQTERQTNKDIIIQNNNSIKQKHTGTQNKTEKLQLSLLDRTVMTIHIFPSSLTLFPYFKKNGDPSLILISPLPIPHSFSPSSVPSFFYSLFHFFVPSVPLPLIQHSLFLPSTAFVTISLHSFTYSFLSFQTQPRTLPLVIFHFLLLKQHFFNFPTQSSASATTPSPRCASSPTTRSSAPSESVFFSCGG